MDCITWRKNLKSWLTKYWLHTNKDIEIPDSLKSHAGECKECFIRLKSVESLIKKTGFQETVPSRLSKEIYKYVSEHASAKKPHRLPWILVPLSAAALVIITFLFTYQLFIHSPQTIIIHLRVEALDATSVSVVGDWNNWKPDADILKDPDGDGIWDIRLKLRKNNEYRYQFLINGSEWIPDPSSALYIEDGFGGVNSILEI